MINHISISSFVSPFGELVIGAFGERLVLCDWKYRKMRNNIDARIKSGLNAEFKEETTPTIEQTKTQLKEYFRKERTQFDVPVQFVGTNFQQSVWAALMEVPFGKTKSYLALAKLLGNQKAIRAVASANGANAISIIVPCHRVIGSNGDLTGYAGGLTTKKKLLELEGKKHQFDLF